MFWAYEQWKKDRAKREKLVREAWRAEERQRLAQWIEDGHTVEEWLAQPIEEVAQP